MVVKYIKSLLPMLLSGKKCNFYLIIFFQILVGVIPALIIFLIGNAVDSISNPKEYFLIIICICICIFLLDLIEVFEAILSSIVVDYSKKNMQNFLIKKSINSKTIDHHFNDKYRDIFYLIEAKIGTISGFVGDFSIFLVGFINLLAISSLLSTLNWWIPLILLLSMLPIAYARYKAELNIWEAESSNSDKFSIIIKLYEHLTRAESSKSIRVDNYKDIIFSQWQSTYTNILDKISKQRLNGFYLFIVMSIPAIILLLLVFILIYSGKNITITKGGMVILFASILQIRTSLTTIISNFSEVIYGYKASLFIFKLDDLLRKGEVKNKSFDQNINFKNISFSYNGINSIFFNLSLSFKINNTYFIVGKNGTGKTTFAEIISGMTSNYHGEVSYPFSVDKILYLSQDIKKLPLSVRDFIDPYKNFSNHEIMNAINKFELYNISISDIDKVIDSNFENNIGFSGGQWQRLLMSKIYLTYTNYNLIIADEINSALDKRGDELFKNLILFLAGKVTLIIITHKHEMLGSGITIDLGNLNENKF